MIIFIHKNFAASMGICNIGLGVAATNTSLTLKEHGYDTDVVGITKYQDIDTAVWQYKPSHVVLAAPWVPPHYVKFIVEKRTDTQFVTVCHSNVGFLFADSNGIRNFRAYFEIQEKYPNFRIAGNSRKFQRWVMEAYSVPCLFLPNLYYLAKKPSKKKKLGDGVLRIGCFGATRPLKNAMTAAGVALEISTQLKRPVEFWLSAGRSETGAEGVRRAIGALLEGTRVTIVDNLWQPWDEFRKTVATMDLLLQISYTESFNMVTADGIAEGVPSVVSEAIDWCPEEWVANVDDCDEIASVAIDLLDNPHQAVHKGRKKLEAYINDGIKQWEIFLQKKGKESLLPLHPGLRPVPHHHHTHLPLLVALHGRYT